MQFNGLELSAIVKLAKAMAAADGKIARVSSSLFLKTSWKHPC